MSQEEKSGKKTTSKGNGCRNRRAFDDRKARAIARQTEYAKLTTKQKLEKLDQKLGAGVGAAKERAKLLKEKK